MNRRHTRILPLVLGLGLYVACSSDGEKPEPIGTSSEAVSSCGDGTFGAPCDPDGTGPLSTCQGACYPGRQGGIACLTLTLIGWDADSLDGRVCGSIGSECNMVCTSGACKTLADGGLSASNGQACRVPGIGTIPGNTCSGACQNGTCRALADPCRYGRTPAGAGNCFFSACDFAAPTKCVSYPLLADSVCNDNNLCTGTDRCHPSDGSIDPVCSGNTLPICTFDGSAAGGAGGIGFGGFAGFGGLTGGTGGIGGGGLGGVAGVFGSAGTQAGGASGSGGSAGGNAGGAGKAGTSAGGMAGTSAGGMAGTSGGTAGTSAAGSAGTAAGGMAGTSGGAAGTSSSGAAGTSGGAAGASTGGAAGTSGGGTAGTSTGGTAGSSAGGSGGASQAGSGGGSGARDAGTGKGGSSILGAEDDGGCACRVAGSESSGRSLFAFALGALALCRRPVRPKAGGRKQDRQRKKPRHHTR